MAAYLYYFGVAMKDSRVDPAVALGDVFDKVLSHVDGRNLAVTGKVSTLWQRVATRENEHRKIRYRNKFQRYFPEIFASMQRRDQVNSVQRWSEVFQARLDFYLSQLEPKHRALLEALEQGEPETLEVITLTDSVFQKELTGVPFFDLEFTHMQSAIKLLSMAKRFGHQTWVDSVYAKQILPFYRQAGRLDVTQKDTHGRGIFHWAIATGQKLTHLQALLREGVDPVLVDIEMFDPLSVAALNNDMAAIDLIRNECLRLQVRPIAPFLAIFFWGQTTLLEMTLANLDSLSWTDSPILTRWARNVTHLVFGPLFSVVCHCGNSEFVRLFLQNAARIQYDIAMDVHSLSAACKNKDTTLMRLLLTEGIDPNGCRVESDLPSAVCATQGFVEGLELLLSFGATCREPFDASHSFLKSDFNYLRHMQTVCQPNLELIHSAMTGDTASLQRIIESVQTREFAQSMPISLTYAIFSPLFVQHDSATSLSYLLDEYAKANPGSQRVPVLLLHVACECGRPEMVKVLLRHLTKLGVLTAAHFVSLLSVSMMRLLNGLEGPAGEAGIARLQENPYFRILYLLITWNVEPEVMRARKEFCISLAGRTRFHELIEHLQQIDKLAEPILQVTPVANGGAPQPIPALTADAVYYSAATLEESLEQLLSPMVLATPGVLLCKPECLQNLECVTVLVRLLQQSAESNLVIQQQLNTALYHAATLPDTTVFDFLRAAGADPTWVNPETQMSAEHLLEAKQAERDSSVASPNPLRRGPQ
jgi:hypothetical protein